MASLLMVRINTSNDLRIMENKEMLGTDIPKKKKKKQSYRHSLAILQKYINSTMTSSPGKETAGPGIHGISDAPGLDRTPRCD